MSRIGRHLISIDDLDRQGMERILDRAESFAEVSGREIKKVPALGGRTVVNLFYEASTRTSSSFELAAKRLSADVVNIRSAGSSVDKGVSLKDTVQTLSAYDPAAIVIRSPHAGAAQLVAGWTPASVINAARLRPGQLLMHPGPVNRGVELSADAIDSPQGLIGEQVKAVVAVRMAVLYELLVGSPVLAAVA